MDAAVDWEAFMGQFPHRLGASFSKFVPGPAALVSHERLVTRTDPQTYSRPSEPESAVQLDAQVAHGTSGAEALLPDTRCSSERLLCVLFLIHIGT